MDRRDFIEKSALAAGGALLAGTGVEALANDKKGKTMKVLMINGSPHQQGNTAVALDEIAKQLKVNGIDSEIVWIGNKAVRGCIACGGCSRKPGKCVFDDDICNRISEKFAEADALIVGSPVYYGQPNGAVLSVIQRAFYSNGASISGKPAAAVAVCRRGGATASFETLNMPFQMMNMPVVGCGGLPVLEYPLWCGPGSGIAGHGRSSDDACPGQQHGLAAQGYRRKTGSGTGRRAVEGDEFYPLMPSSLRLAS